MPLDRYGVLVGTLHSHYRDQPDTQGRWFHVNVEVNTNVGRYRCAVDVDSKQSATGVQWRTLRLSAAALTPVPGLGAGYHDLVRGPDSGALDYYRHPALTRGCRLPQSLVRFEWLFGRLATRRRWTSGSNSDAADAFEPMLVPGRRVLVFGEPFTSGLGLHNIHQNQGDPPGSQWWAENAIWQDGGTLTERPDGQYDAFLSKFTTQATQTDEQGHPI